MVKIWTMKSCEKCEFFHCFLKPPPIGQNLNYKILLKICIFSLFFKSSPYWSKFELWNLAKNLHFFSIFLKAPPIGQNLHFAIIHLHTTLCKVIEIEQNFSVKFWKNSWHMAPRVQNCSILKPHRICSISNLFKKSTELPFSYQKLLTFFKIEKFKNRNRNSVEISEFVYHSDFICTQFLWMPGLNICHF